MKPVASQVRPTPGSRVLFVVRIAVSLALVAWLVLRIGLSTVLETIGTAHPEWLMLSVLTLVPAIALRALSMLLLANKDQQDITFSQAGALTLVGMSSQLVLPPGLADLARAHIGYRTLGRPESIVSASLLDRITSLLALLVLGGGAAAVAGYPTIALVGVGAAAVLLILLLLPRMVPWHWIVRMLSAGATLDSERLQEATRLDLRTLSRVLVVASAGWLSSAFTVYFICLAMGTDVTLAVATLATLLTAIARLIPISAAGIGVGEWTLGYVLISFGVAENTAAGIALVTLVVGLLLPGFVGLFATPRQTIQTVEPDSSLGTSSAGMVPARTALPAETRHHTMLNPNREMTEDEEARLLG